MNYLCRKFPYVMRPLLLLLGLTGIMTLFLILSVGLVNYDGILDCHKEVYKYVRYGVID